MKRKHYGEWVRLSYHCPGVSLSEYQEMSIADRTAIHAELGDWIETMNEGGEEQVTASRPMRRMMGM